MAFDPTLDVEKWGEEIEFEGQKIKVSVMSYNEGIQKLQVARQKQNAEGEWSFAKLGRMTKEEVEKILPAMQKCVEKME